MKEREKAESICSNKQRLCLSPMPTQYNFCSSNVN